MSFTYDRYGHLFPEVDNEAAAKLNVVRTSDLGSGKAKRATPKPLFRGRALRDKTMPMGPREVIHMA